jgi:hypothetical protein
MNMAAVSEEENVLETHEEPVRTNNRIVSMECPFQAFKVITHECDLDYIKKLAALLTNITVAMN